MQVVQAPKRKIDYQQVLLDSAKSMVRLRQPERLLKMITRHIDKQHNVSHTSILIFKEDRGHYTFVDSKGKGRIPPNLVKFELNHPLVHWFARDARKSAGRKEYLSRAMIQRKLLGGNKGVSETMQNEIKFVRRMMETLKVELVIPGYYKKNLLGLLLLGPKRDNRPFRRSEINFFQILTHDCSMAVKTAEYHRGLLEKNRELGHRLREIEHMRCKEQQNYYGIVKSLVQEVYAKDAYTFDHISEVERLGIMTARELGVNIAGKKKDVLSAGLILHDVGKIGVPDHILNKPSQLTKEEWRIMQTHVDKGVMILEPLKDFNDVREIVRCHHENFDGTGYPRKLKGCEIPLESRIIAVVDAFHTIITTRCYSVGRHLNLAFAELERCAGAQFDPQVVEAFVRVMKKDIKKKGVKKLPFASPAESEELREKGVS